jgi:hypothetical protein
MIKANECRTGNLIFLGGKHVAKIIQINSEANTITTENPYNRTIGGMTGDNIYLPSGFATGIPITPEWLKRCGFEDMGTYWQYNGEPGFVLLKDKEGVAYIGNPVRTYVKTVHHLQNLYFALTEGVELKY